MHIASWTEEQSKLAEDRRVLAAGAVATAALIAVVVILMIPVPSASRRPLVARLATRLGRGRHRRRSGLEAQADGAKRQLVEMASAIAGGLQEAKTHLGSVVWDLARRWDRGHARVAAPSRRG